MQKIVTRPRVACFLFSPCSLVMFGGSGIGFPRSKLRLCRSAREIARPVFRSASHTHSLPAESSLNRQRRLTREGLESLCRKCFRRKPFGEGMHMRGTRAISTRHKQFPKPGGTCGEEVRNAGKIVSSSCRCLTLQSIPTGSEQSNSNGS